MKTITTLFSLILLIGCSTTQSNIKIDSIETFNLDNYNDFNIKINNSNIGAEVNPIVLEKFKENLKNAINLLFQISLSRNWVSSLCLLLYHYLDLILKRK